jgi:hypothetical protein
MYSYLCEGITVSLILLVTFPNSFLGFDFCNLLSLSYLKQSGCHCQMLYCNPFNDQRLTYNCFHTLTEVRKTLLISLIIQCLLNS